jgi:hypothetical protein
MSSISPIQRCMISVEFQRFSPSKSSTDFSCPPRRSASRLRRHTHRHTTTTDNHLVSSRTTSSRDPLGGIYPGAKLGLREIPATLHLLTYPPGHGRALRSVRAYPGLASPRYSGPPPQGGIGTDHVSTLADRRFPEDHRGPQCNLLATAPLLTAGWLASTGREHLERRHWSGLVLGFIGVGFVVQSGSIGVTWSQFGGDLLALGAAGAWAWYSLVIGPLVGALGTVRATGWTMVVAALCCTPLVLVETRDYAWRSVSWEAWAGLVYGATLGMVTAMALWGRSIHRLGRSRR